MDIGSIFLIMALLILVGWFIGRPLFERKTKNQILSTTVIQQDHERSTLLAERDRAINALHELDFDYTLGKIPEADYPAQRSLMLQYGSEVLRKLDALHEVLPVTSAEDRLESAIAARKAAQTATPKLEIAPEPDDQIETMIAMRRRSQSEKASGFCHKCGGPVQKSDLFCPKCGTALRT
jgi:flagellar biogenesis protein FliO